MLATMYIKPGDITSSWEALVHISYNVRFCCWTTKIVIGSQAVNCKVLSLMPHFQPQVLSIPDTHSRQGVSYVSLLYLFRLFSSIKSGSHDISVAEKMLRVSINPNNPNSNHETFQNLKKPAPPSIQEGRHY
jgi:hypothetical protein